MDSVRGLRLSLALQAAAVALPIAVALAVGAYAVVDKLVGSCAYGTCAGFVPGLVLEAVILFAGPVWWTVSGARRAGLLTVRQLAWLLAVNAYLVGVGLELWAQAREHLNEQAPLSEALTVLTAFAVVSTALVSSVTCAGRILRLRRRARSAL